MKQTLRSRGGLCPKPRPIIHPFYTLFLTFTIVLVSCVCSVAQVSASSPEAGPAAGAVAEIKPLKIGDTIPDALWNLPLQMIKAGQEGSTIVRLNDYKGKLIILDFWATWCGSCIKNMPKMEHLQGQFKGKVEVVMVSSQGPGEVRGFLSKRGLNLASVIEDDQLKHAFPHLYIPHYVVINPGGTIEGISSSDQMTEGNIKDILEGANPEMRKKVDKSTDMPLFSSAGLPIGQLCHSSMFLKGRLDGYPSSIEQRHFDKEQVVGASYTNQTLLSLFKVAIRKLYPDIPNNRIILDVQDSSKLYYTATSISRHEWYKDNLYSYEVLLPENQLEGLYKGMLNDLNDFSSCTGKMLKRKIPCLKLVVLKKGKPIPSGAGITNVSGRTKSFRDAPIAALVDYLDGSRLHIPVIDGTGFGGKINMAIQAGFRDLNEIRAELNRYNLDLIYTKQEMKVFVIAETVNNTEK